MQIVQPNFTTFDPEYFNSTYLISTNAVDSYEADPWVSGTSYDQTNVIYNGLVYYMPTLVIDPNMPPDNPLSGWQVVAPYEKFDWKKWVSGNAYEVGDVVLDGVVGTYYCIQAITAGSTESYYRPSSEDATLLWADLDQTVNTLAMFDNHNSTKTLKYGPPEEYTELITTIRIQDSNSFGLLYMQGYRCDTWVYSGDPSVPPGVGDVNNLSYTLLSAPDWNTESSYVEYDVVYHNNILYQCVQAANNTVNPPLGTDGVLNSSYWQEWLPVYDPATSYDAGTYVMWPDPKRNRSPSDPDLVSDYAIYVLEGSAGVQGEPNTSEGTAWSQIEIQNGTTYLASGEIYNWYDYFFSNEYATKRQAYYLDIATGYIDSYIKVVLGGVTVPGQPLEIGNMPFGRKVVLGSTEYGVGTGITDYSIKETNEYGYTVLQQREYSKRIDATILIPNANLNASQRALYDIRATPILWVASVNPQLEEPLVVFGYYKNFSTDITYPNYSYCSLEIEGLV